MIIDAHTHMFHRTSLEQLSGMGGAWAKKKVALAVDGARHKPQVHDITQRLELLNRNGIDMQVVTPPHILYCSHMPRQIDSRKTVIRIINDGMARLMEESKGKLIGVGTIPLVGFETGDQQEMERAINKLGLKAICVPSHVNGKPLDLPEFEPFWAQAADMGIPVYIHPDWPTGYKDRSYEADYDLSHNFGWPFETMLALSRLIFSGIVERHPKIKVVSHHLGGGIPFFLGRIMETYHPSRQEQIFGRVLPRSLFDYFSLFYYDTAVGGSAPAVRCAYEVFGADHLLFATDDPFGPGTGEGRLTSYPKVIESLDVSEEKKITYWQIMPVCYLI